MAGTTYKCPNCGAYLTFNPEQQAWSCPFCDSTFEESVLLEKEAEYAQSAPEPETVPTADGEQVMYRCANCGSEIMTDETTVATQCYYCHSPVVLQGKLTSDMKPESVLPFAVNRDKALKTFMSWIKSKRYVPKAFFSEAQVQSLCGVYYPHFVTECDVEGSVDGEGRKVDVTNTAKYVITSTHHYHVRRDANFTFRHLMRPALRKSNRKLSDGIHPFPLEKEKPFSSAYLSGFLAERRDVDAESIQADIAGEVERYVEPMLKDTMHYDSTTLRTSAQVKRIKTRYVLLPTWVLTYPNKQKKDDPYYYAMNGCTGNICGKLPIAKKKLYLDGLLIGALIFAAGCIISYFLF